MLTRITVLVNIVLEVQDDAVSTGKEIKDVKEELNRRHGHVYRKF